MKRIIYLFLTIFLFSSSLKSQESDWVEDYTFKAIQDTIIASRVWIADVNGDNYPDLLVGGPKATHNNLQLYLNVANDSGELDNPRIFINYTEESGINQSRDNDGEPRVSDIAALADLDNDGDIDIVSSIYFHRLQFYLPNNDPGDRSEILLNDGTGKFTLFENSGINDLPFPQSKPDSVPNGLFNTTGISFLDYDLDGNLDMYFGTWFSDYAFNEKMADLLFKGNGDGTFTHVTNSGIESVVEPLYGTNATDWNNDGWMDIVTSPYCRSDGSIFRNNGDGTFTDVAKEANYSANHLARHGSSANLCQWEAMPADFDNDGDIDILQTLVHGGYAPGIGRTVIAVNGGEENNYRLQWDIDRIQRDAPANSHLGDMGANWFDLDGDGKLDMAIGQMSYPNANRQGQERLYILRQNNEGYFEDISRDIGIFHTMKEAHSMESLDYDLDGDNDLFFSRQVRDTVVVDTLINDTLRTIENRYTYMQIHLLRNNIGNRDKNFIWVKLDPPAYVNQSAVGSRIKVHANGLTQTKEVLAGNGHFGGQDDFIKLFNLADKNRVDSIEVFWQRKDNRRTVIYNPPLNVLQEISEDSFISYDPKTNELPNPTLAFELPYLDFDSVDVGATKRATANIINLKGQMTIESLALENNEHFKIVSELSLPVTLGEGESYGVEIEFTPSQRGIYLSTMQIGSNTQKAMRKYDIEGFGFEPKPIITASLKNVFFDSTYIDQPAMKPLKITNSGEEPLTINAFLFSNSDGVFYLEGLPDLPHTLESGETLDLELNFNPQERIEYTSILDIVSDAYNDNNLEIEITGIGDGPKAYVVASTERVQFLGTYIGSPRTATFMLQNPGDGPLSVDRMIISQNNDNAYTILNYEEPDTIPAGEAKTYEVEFNPVEVGLHDRLVTIRTNSWDKEIPQIRLVATALSPQSVSDSFFEARDFEVSISPNPASDYFFITLNAKNNLGNYKISLFDLQGNEVMMLDRGLDLVGEFNKTVETSLISSGNYYLVVSTKSERLTVPLIINR